MRRSVVLLVACLFVGSCSDGSDNLPIPADRLQDVLIDVYAAEGHASLSGHDIVAARDSALRSHGFDTVAFNSTIRLLMEQPELAREIYQAVLDSVIREQRQIVAKQQADSARAGE